MPIIIKTILEDIMNNKEIDMLFNKGMELMKKGNFREAEALFEKAKNMTAETQNR